jgi:cyclic 2,3-diphosphoglycerate synthetase
VTRVLVLVDGEHYPPVVRAAIAARPGVVGAALLGGIEKLSSPPDYGVPHVTGETPAAAVLAAIDRFAPDEVHDLADEPVLDARQRLRVAAMVLTRGLPYVGSDFRFAPPPRPVLAARPSVAVIGSGKRAGKTAVTTELARLLKDDGAPPVIVTMGRGGPPEPELIDPATADLSAAGLVAFAERGRHAASDHLEDALGAGVVTIGTRRCGGGLAGAPADDTFGAGVELANSVAAHTLLFEGSGTAIPPVDADATIYVVDANADFELVTGYLGLYRVLLADLIVVTMAEQPLVDSQFGSTVGLEAKVRELAAGVGPAKAVVRTVFRPVPLTPVSGRRVFFATTAAGPATEVMATHLAREHGAEVVGHSNQLGNRRALAADLERMGAAEILVVELKASAIDLAARTALERGMEVVFYRNEVVTVGGDGTFEELARTTVQSAVERHRQHR